MTSDEASGLRWTKSSYSNANGGNCAEVALSLPSGLVPLRDSKLAGCGPVVVVGAAPFSDFLRSVVKPL
ncbi:DUF397 domain-containing protein [Streptomyces sp. SID11233]|nr:DUF397 domain-containing protein [Streptomyces sp. SID11385]NED85123.1 DUF397 domain-containing protein [Streptomyces sp. SID11233]